LGQAISRSYAWKAPIHRTKNKDFSLALQFVALIFFLLRLVWLIQPIKVLVRWNNGPEEDIPAWVNEVYVMGSLAIESAICIAITLRPIPLLTWVHALGWLLILKVIETVTSNVYYLALRPVLRLKAPHSTYRSFILASFGLLEVWLLLSLAWYCMGTTCPKIDSVLTAMYFTSVTFFTVGYGDYIPKGNFSHGLAIFSIFVSVGMIGIVLSRAISLLRPLPEPGTPNGETPK
jgi:hypothetical protein